MPITYTPEALQRIVYATYDGVQNKKNPLKVDRKKMIWRDTIRAHKVAAPLAGANGVVVKYKTAATGVNLQGWERRDVLNFVETGFEQQIQLPWSNVHSGVELVHDDLEAMGYIILPNQSRGKDIGKADSRSEAFRLVDYISEMIESVEDQYDVKEDQLLLTDNSSNPKLPQGLDAYLPLGSATGYVTTGSLGGKARATNPEFQHYHGVGATTATGGTLATMLNTARREAQLQTRGRPNGGVKFIMAGAAALDGYVAYARNNNLQFQTMLGDGARGVDVGISDSGVQFQGIPIVHNPTFEILDGLLAPTIPWTKRFYLIDPTCWGLAFAPGKDKFFSAPADPSDRRITRLSYDSKMVLMPMCINGNAIVSLA